MFNNPLFQWWMESLEERSLRSASDVAPPPIEARADQGASGDLIALHAPQQLTRLANRAAMGGDDNAFVTDWFIADDEPTD